jgi:hypothetical protein
MMADLSGEQFSSSYSNLLVLHTRDDVNVRFFSQTYIMHAADGQFGPNVGQAIFSLWMALGSVLGYSSGANAKWPEYVVKTIHTPIGFLLLLYCIIILSWFLSL